MSIVRCVAALTLAAGVSCINQFVQTDATPHNPRELRETSFRSPVKVHMVDGSTVVYRAGASVTSGMVVGAGWQHPLMSDSGAARDRVPLDSVVAFESFDQTTLAAPSIVVSAAATVVGGLATLAILKALFGSCPTVYADTGTGPVLEAEGFSYAIAPLFEHRDVDRLRARPDSDGIIRLEVRNEAMETHFINHVEVAAVAHRTNQFALPDQGSRPVLVDDVVPLTAATDRGGRDVRAVLDAADGATYSSSPSVIAGAQPGDLDDWIDLEASDVAPGDSIAVVLRLRNSLLNTVLLYDGILAASDGIEWVSRRLQNIAVAVHLSRWYTRTMGMRVETSNAATRLNDVGPIAFHDVAIVLPRPTNAGSRVRVRLRFVADNWRIDRAAIAGHVTRPAATLLPVSRVVVPAPAGGGPAIVDAGARAALAEPDDQYYETRPGQRVVLEFEPGRAKTDSSMTTTYMIAWQGWYREWIRRDWVTKPHEPFVPGDSAVYRALRRWQERKPDFEREFYQSRVPVR